MASARTVTIPTWRTEWTLPVPREHGAWVLALAALLTPLTVAMVRAPSWMTHLPVFGLLVVVVLCVLFCREAFRRWHRRSGADSALGTVVAFESVAVLLLVTGLVVAVGWIWALGYLLVPAVVVDDAVRRHGGWPLPMGNELAGVLFLSLAVPGGALLFGIDPFRTVVPLWGMYVCYHAAGVVRVRTSMGLGRPTRRRSVTTGIGTHALLLGLVAIGWEQGLLGVAALPAFAVATLYAAWLLHEETSPAKKALGRREAVLASLFVLTAPWLVP